jgi:hypothetical protein
VKKKPHPTLADVRRLFCHEFIVLLGLQIAANGVLLRALKAVKAKKKSRIFRGFFTVVTQNPMVNKAATNAS